MAGFETPQISVTPYESKVPLVQMPERDLQTAPTPGAIYSKGGGIATLADGMMKGMLRGLQMKEEKKYKTAEAVMNAQDARISAADKNYQNLLITKGADSEETKAAWASKVALVNQAADQREAYAIPKKETGTKSQKKEQGAKDKAAGIPVQGGFGDHFKHFLSRNPQILPQLAIMGMRSQVDPKLYGQMTPELTQQKQQYDAAQRVDSDQKVVFAARQTIQGYGGKSRAELQAEPPTPGGKAAGFKNALEEYNNALAVMNPPKPTPAARPGTPEFYYDKKAQELGKDVQDLTSEELQDAKAEWAEAGRAESQANLYYDAAAREWGTTRDKLTTAQLEYVDANRARSQAQAKGQATYSYRTTDANGNSSTVTRKVSEPIATPQGVKELPKGVFSDGQEGAQSQPAASSSGPRSSSRGFRPPAAPGAGRGNFAAGMPSQGGGRTLTQVNRDLKTEKDVSDEYEKNEDWLGQELDKIRSASHSNNPLSPDEAKADTARVTDLYNKKKAGITRRRISQIEAVGGDPWKQKSKDSQGNEIGTMDDVSWKNTRTGYDVPAPSGGPQAAPTATQGAAAGQKKEPNPAKKTEAGSEIKSYGDPGPGKKAYIIRCADGSEARLYLDEKGLAIIKSHPTTAGVVEDN
jgi:hypothetical protein